MATLKPLPKLVTTNEKAIWENLQRLNADIVALVATTIPAVLTAAVILAPASGTRNRIQPTGDFIPLVIRGSAGQTSSLLTLENSAGATLTQFDSNGSLTISSGSVSSVSATVQNTSTGAAVLNLVNSSTGDAYVVFNTSANPSYIGVDNSDSDRFKISVVNTPGGAADMLIIDPSNKRMHFGQASSGSAMAIDTEWHFQVTGITCDLRVQNNSSSSSAHAGVSVRAWAGDPYIRFIAGITDNWILGTDVSDSSALVLSSGASVGAAGTTVFRVDPTTRHVEFKRAYTDALVQVTIENTYNSGSTAGAVLNITSVAGVGDAYMVFRPGTWSYGVDNSDSDSLVWSENATLGSNNRLKIHPGGNIEVYKDIILPTATGTKIGTTTDQLLGFWNATPVDQPAHIADADGTLADGTTKINAILDLLEETGLMAA